MNAKMREQIAKERAAGLAAVERLQTQVAALRARIESAPAAIMDTRDVLGICAPTEEDFPALYALRGKRVRLVIDEPHNPNLSDAKRSL